MPCNTLREYRCAECRRPFTVDYGVCDPAIMALVTVRCDAMRCPLCAAAAQERADAAEREEKRRRRLADSGIPPEFTRWDPALGNRALHDWLWRHRERSLFISDDYDTNKTRCMAAVGAELAATVSVRFWNAAALGMSYTGAVCGGDHAGWRFVAEQCRCGLLIIDDLGKQRFTESGGAACYAIVNTLYERGPQARLWVSANLSGAALARRFDCPDTGAAVVSRLRRMCLAWPGTAAAGVGG